MSAVRAAPQSPQHKLKISSQVLQQLPFTDNTVESQAILNKLHEADQ